MIELLIVIAILGILAAIVTPVLIRARFKTYHSACIQNIRNLATALELYSLEHEGLYPTDLRTLAAGPSPYISSIETCPTNYVSYHTQYNPNNGNRGYIASCPGTHENQLPGIVLDFHPRAIDGRMEPDRPL